MLKVSSTHTVLKLLYWKRNRCFHLKEAAYFAEKKTIYFLQHNTGSLWTKSLIFRRCLIFHMSHAIISVIDQVNRTSVPIPQISFFYFLTLWVKMNFTSGILSKLPVAKDSNRKKNHHLSKMHNSWVLSFFFKDETCKYRATETQTEKAKNAALSPGCKICIRAGTWAAAAAAAGATGTAVQSMWGILPVPGPGLQVIFLQF